MQVNPCSLFSQPRRRSARARIRPADNNVAIDINNAAPGDIEQLPPDESVDTSSNELINGADNADVNADLNAPENAY